MKHQDRCQHVGERVDNVFLGVSVGVVKNVLGLFFVNCRLSTSNYWLAFSDDALWEKVTRSYYWTGMLSPFLWPVETNNMGMAVWFSIIWWNSLCWSSFVKNLHLRSNASGKDLKLSTTIILRHTTTYDPRKLSTAPAKWWLEGNFPFQRVPF